MKVLLENLLRFEDGNKSKTRTFTLTANAAVSANVQ